MSSGRLGCVAVGKSGWKRNGKRAGYHNYNTLVSATCALALQATGADVDKK